MSAALNILRHTPRGESRAPPSPRPSSADAPHWLHCSALPHEQPKLPTATDIDCHRRKYGDSRGAGRLRRRVRAARRDLRDAGGAGRGDGGGAGARAGGGRRGRGGGGDAAEGHGAARAAAVPARQGVREHGRRPGVGGGGDAARRRRQARPAPRRRVELPGRVLLGARRVPAGDAHAQGRARAPPRPGDAVQAVAAAAGDGRARGAEGRRAAEGEAPRRGAQDGEGGARPPNSRRPAQFVGPRNSSARAMFRPAHFVGPRNSARARLRRRPRPRPRPAGGRAGAGVAAVLEAPRLLPLQDLRRPRARGRPPDRRQEGVHPGPPPRPRRPRQGRRRRRRRRRRQPDGDGVGGAGAVGGDGGGVCVRRRRPLRHAREHVRRAGGVWRRAAAVRRPPRPPAQSGGAIPPAQRNAGVLRRTPL